VVVVIEKRVEGTISIQTSSVSSTHLYVCVCVCVLYTSTGVYVVYRRYIGIYHVYTDAFKINNTHTHIYG